MKRATDPSLDELLRAIGAELRALRTPEQGAHVPWSAIVAELAADPDAPMQSQHGCWAVERGRPVRRGGLDHVIAAYARAADVKVSEIWAGAIMRCPALYDAFEARRRAMIAEATGAYDPAASMIYRAPPAAAR